jgi:hypothetical protein
MEQVSLSLYASCALILSNIRIRLLDACERKAIAPLREAGDHSGQVHLGVCGNCETQGYM